MRKIGVAVIVALASACAPASDLPTATAAADGFHKQLNAREYEAIYAASDRVLKNTNPSKGFVTMLEDVHNKLGDFRSGDTPGWNDQVTVNGHFVTLIYRSRYARAAAEENFVFRIDGGRAVLVSYHVTSGTPPSPN